MTLPKGTCGTHPELEAGPQEFLSAGNSFNQMISALDGMVSAQQRLISDISHELRTPLTRLQLATALLRRRHGESKELERIETETHRLDSMINDLLVLSRSQHKNEILRENIKADELWGDILDDASFEAEQMNKTLDVTSHPSQYRCTVTLPRWVVHLKISCVMLCVTQTPILLLILKKKTTVF